jgi:class 3 adenylate cyclase
MLDGQRLNEFLIDTRDLKVFGIEFNFFVLYVAGCFQNILYILFSLFFLNIKSQSQSVDKTLKVYCLFVCIFYAFQLFVPYDFDANILWVPFYTTHVAVLLLILGFGINNSIKGQKSALFFNIALVPYVMFRIFYSLGIVKWWSPMSLLPDVGLSYFLKSSAGIQQVLSISLEAIIMSLAVAHRAKALQDAVAQSIKDQKKFIEEQNKTLDLTVTERTLELNAKKASIQELLYNMMPMSIAKELEIKGSSPPIRHDSVTILFTDFVGFTQASSIMPANRMVAELNEIFGEFDRIVQECGVEKIKTIGDSYMAVAGAPVYCEDHALRCAKAALGIIAYIEHRNTTATFKWSLRVGLHSGPVVAGVIGNKRITYDIWGDSVNLASRMESASESNRVNISAYTFDLIRDQYKCEYRGKVPVKGKGEIDMYFIAA